MGFAWMAEGGRHSSGWLNFDDDDGHVGGGGRDLAPDPWPVGPWTLRTHGRHARPKSHHTVLRTLGVAGFYPRARWPSRDPESLGVRISSGRPASRDATAQHPASR